MRNVTLVLTAATLTTLLAQSSPPYRVTRSYTLGGDGSWDYIVPDPPNHRLFIGRQNRVMVVDADNGTLLGEVTGINGAHGTALADPSGHGFATSSVDESVVMFDLKTLKVSARIPAAEDADAIIYDRSSNRVFTFNGDAHSSTVIQPREGKAITTIRWAVSPNTGHRPATVRSTRISRTRMKSSKSTGRRLRWRAAGPPRPASSRWPWRWTPLTIGCSVAAAAA
jgi:hypothetical protein